jgi:hypothetical protein
MTEPVPVGLDEELRPCPFCGREPDTENAHAKGTDIYCAFEDCGGARIFVSVDETQRHGEEAVARWNRRSAIELPPSPEPVGRVPSARLMKLMHAAAWTSMQDTTPGPMLGVGITVDEVLKLIAEAFAYRKELDEASRASPPSPEPIAVNAAMVLVPREEFGRLFATAHELTAYYVTNPPTADHEFVNVCNGDLRKLDERVTLLALAYASPKENTHAE